jgi:polyphosphate kinase 2 (PPK2 family)
MYIAMPSAGFLFKTILPADWWHPVTFFVIMGIIRACAPFAASFQGSRVGRILTREFFKSRRHRWQPVQLVQTLNLTSDDCWEKDEVSQTADLAVLAKKVATALGKAHQIGLDTLQGQSEALDEQGFRQVGAGSGGYAVYQCRRRVFTSMSPEGHETMLLLHVTPYGPSILDVMPRYIVLEFENSVDRRAKWSEYVSKKIYEGPPVLEGYCYQSAFFSPHHFAELKEKYDKELFMYHRACKNMCKPHHGRNPNPPTDLRALKAFLVEGKFGRERKRNERERRTLQNKVQQVADELKSLMRSKNPDGSCKAPNGIILYFEGLDCSGKSSTGGLVEEAMRLAGYNITMAQYNRPPTAEQKLRPWMDRFTVPGATIAVAIPQGSEVEIKKETIDKCINHSHNAVVWDRGPAGDFVYVSIEQRRVTFQPLKLHIPHPLRHSISHAQGALATATPEERVDRFREFMAFDKEMFEKNTLFCKLLFVTNRDSIASTLGKRLAQKKMAKDLRTWLQASRGGESGFGDIGFEGLDEISLHIDPTDFIAFNSYQRNLRIFTNFALNTDSEANPWLVVNTGDRFAARMQLLKSFSVQLQRFKTKRSWSCCPSTATTTREEDTPGISEAEMLERGFKKPLPIRWVVALAGIMVLVFYYCEHTTFGHVISLIIHHNSTETGDSEN